MTEIDRARPAARWPALAGVLLLLAAAPALLAQGPNVEYYYRPGVSLPWAEAALSQGSGSRMSLPFLPVIVVGVQAPVGTAGCTVDVALDVPMAFVGDGIVSDGWDAYRHTWSGDGEALEVASKAVVLCYDCRPPGEPDPSATLAARLATAAGRGAAAVVLFSADQDSPFLRLDPEAVPKPEIPVISLSRTGAEALFEAAGAGGGKLLAELAEGGEPPPGRELITRLHLRIEGAFDRVETEHFDFLFRGSAIPRREVETVARVHEQGLATIRAALGRPGDPPLPRGRTVYFRGFDAKTFYTHHWGAGLANEGGVFLVWPGGEVDPGRIVHEETHTFTGHAWGATSSFLDEGVARYMEAVATDPAMNRTETRRYLDLGKLPPLAEMLPIDVGGDPLTPIAYPAAGSFVEFLIGRYGLDAVRRVYRLEGRGAEEKAGEDTWSEALGEPLARVERAWREWLRSGE